MSFKISFRTNFLVAAASVMLVGTTAWAGTETVLHAFTYSEGNDPNGGVIFDSAGNLYGTTVHDGFWGYGVVFELAPSTEGWTYSTIYTFTGGVDGSYPSSPLVFDAAGNLYGTTFGAYGNGDGTVFKLTPSAEGAPWKFSLLHTFAGGKDGSEPEGQLVFDRAGNLYGLTYTGGRYYAGIVFELTPTNTGPWKETLVHTLTGCDDGALPVALTMDAAGNLYGATLFGGGACFPNGYGMVFELSPVSGGWKERVLHYFTGKIDGGLPQALAFDSSVHLYGAAGLGGNRTYCTQGCGLIFRLTPSSDGVWHESVLHNFNGGNGLGPGTLLFDHQSNLYGSACCGGGVGWGLVFSLAADQNWAETVLYDFNNTTDGGGPAGPLVLDGAGNLYGTATNSGAGYGVVFEVTP